MPITIPIATQMNRNSPPSPRKLLDRPVQVALLRDVVAAVPPHAGEAERKLRQPDDAEAEHREQHPRADPARGGLAGEHGAASRVEREHDDAAPPSDSRASIRRKRS